MNPTRWTRRAYDVAFFLVFTVIILITWAAMWLALESH